MTKDVADLPSLREALQELVDAREAEAKAIMSYENAQANFTNPKPEQNAAFDAAMRASKAEKTARAVLAALEAAASPPTDEHKECYGCSSPSMCATNRRCLAKPEEPPPLPSPSVDWRTEALEAFVAESNQVVMSRSEFREYEEHIRDLERALERANLPCCDDCPNDPANYPGAT